MCGKSFKSITDLNNCRWSTQPHWTKRLRNIPYTVTAYVLSLGLSHYDFKQGQKLMMTFNWVMKNVITEPWLGLNPRSKVAAPVVIASNNVRVERNILQNPESRYELGSHLIEPNTELDCRHNWIGDKDEQLVWSKIFDRDDRYNLAKIAYIPYLLSNNINTELVLERPLF